jgi:hypothetical protein
MNKKLWKTFIKHYNACFFYHWKDLLMDFKTFENYINFEIFYTNLDIII